MTMFPDIKTRWMEDPELQATTMPKIAVVIPCYRVKRHIGRVIAGIGPEVNTIYCVDDACPEGSGLFIESTIADSRVRVV